MGAVLKGGEIKLGSVVDEAVEAAEVGRKGAADLEKHVDSIKNFFFRDGVQMVVDGYSLDELTEILETRIEYREIREKTQASLFKSMGVMSPAWGMVGTLIGLVIMLSGFFFIGWSFWALCWLVGRDNGVIGDFFSSGGHSGHCVGSLGGIME